MIDANSGDVALTFDDISLVPDFTSDLEMGQITIRSPLARFFGNINIPFLSAAMDTVTESRLAIALAQLGGLGVIHRNLSIESQVEEVIRVKRSESGKILNPICIGPRQTIGDARRLMDENGISGLPVIDSDGKLVGILTRRDIKFETNLSQFVEARMSREVITGAEGIALGKAEEVFREKRIEKLPLVTVDGKLAGLITLRDLRQIRLHPNALKDEGGRLRVGAAIGAGERAVERAHALIRAGVDILVIDVAHGHTQSVVETIKTIKGSFPTMPLIAGNVVTKRACVCLCQAGADAIKVGMGGGSICTTRIITGVGVPQITAIQDCVAAAEKYTIPVIADGGIRFSGDIVKALAAGASAVMVGSLFAGTEESPGELVIRDGSQYKKYQGMGSLDVIKEMRGRGESRYAEGEEIVPEGVTGLIPYKGPLSKVVAQLTGGLRSGMFDCGAASLELLQRKAKFVRISPAGNTESHPHNIIITQEPINYWVRK